MTKIVTLDKEMSIATTTITEKLCLPLVGLLLFSLIILDDVLSDILPLPIQLLISTLNLSHKDRDHSNGNKLLLVLTDAGVVWLLLLLDESEQ